jgi:lauroyl/myristoyl acyltransferase
LKSLLRRFSIYGDFWLRYLHWGTRHCPWFLEPMFVFALTFMFWCVLGRARSAVAKNLRVILPGSSPLMNQVRVIRVFWNFAWTMVDVSRVRHGEECIRWEVGGADHLEALEKKDGPGAILLTAHMGNYDVAAPLFAQKIHRPIHLVRAPEREHRSQEFEKNKRDKQVTGNFVIHYNEPGNMLGVTLARAMGEGGIVAIQGDRILFDVSPMTVTFREGVTWQVPRGPFTLALVANAAIHPVFIIRQGWRRYRVQAEPPMVLTVQDRDRERAQVEAAAQWGAVMRRMMELHWRQWFVFEEVFRGSGASAPEPTSMPQAVDERVDVVIPSQARRGVKTVFAWNLLVGGWTSAVVLRHLLEWAIGDVARVVGALVAWPIVWLLVMVVVVQLCLGIALLLMRLLRMPPHAYDALSCGITTAALAGIAWSEFVGGCPVGWWLGVAGFAGIAVGLVQEFTSRMARG